MEFGGVEVGVGRGAEGTGGGAESLEFGLHCLESLRFLFREVVLLSGVVGEVVEFGALQVVEGDEFPVAFAEGGAGGAALVAPVRVVPVEGAVGLEIGGGVFQEGGEAGAVEVLFGEGGEAGVINITVKGTSPLRE